jgi:hypothetical protein
MRIPEGDRVVKTSILLTKLINGEGVWKVSAIHVITAESTASLKNFSHHTYACGGTPLSAIKL